MIRTAAPMRYDRQAASGRSRPLRVAVQTDDGVEHEVFLKASAAPELDIEGLANEAIAACLAGDLGLPINEPFLVNLDADWASSIPDGEISRMLAASAPIAFGSRAAGDQWKVWSGSDTISSHQSSVALSIFAFDAYIANDDRKPINPNCLIKGDSFRIIDHELAFRIAQKLFPRPAPWE